MKRIAVIGFGARAEGLLRNINTFSLDAEITAVCDPDEAGARARLRSAGFDDRRAAFFRDAEDMLSREKPDGVVIATRCDLHAGQTLCAMRFGLPMLLEKPVVIDEAQYAALAAAARDNRAPTLVSFPLRGSYLMRLVKKLVDGGALGKLSHIEAVNNVSYGRVYYKSWYRDERVTGGLFMQKATHDLDIVNYLMNGVRPVEVCAMESKRIFTGDRPAGLTCDACDRRDTCPESVRVLKNDYHGEEAYGNGCSFAVDTGNHDSASVLVRYENGLHAVYTQDFTARRGAAKRGARLIGFDATLEFDWITGDCVVYDHRDKQTARYHIDDSEQYHYGGDKALCENFMEIMDGKPSLATLRDGLLSARVCLCARRSARERAFVPIETEA